MNKKTITGQFNFALGKFQESVGSVLGNVQLQRAAQRRQMDGRIMHAVGEAVCGFSEFQEHAAEVLGVAAVGQHRLRVHLREGLHLTARPITCLVKRLQVREHALRARAEDEGDGVNPVSADVTDGAELAALAREQTPVVIGRVQQPVLKKMSLHVDDLPEVAALHQRAHLKHGRKEPAHVVHRKDRRARALRGGDDAPEFSDDDARKMLFGAVYQQMLDDGIVRKRPSIRLP